MKGSIYKQKDGIDIYSNTFKYSGAVYNLALFINEAIKLCTRFGNL